MLDYEFMRLVSGYIKIYSDFPLPAVICDRSFQVYWSNAKAKCLYPSVTGTETLGDILAEFTAELILEHMEREGSCTLADALPFSGVSLCAYPIFSEEKPIGVVLLVLAEAVPPAGEPVYLTSKTADALNASIRECVDGIFSTMDAAALKADLLQSGWIKADLNRIGTAGYRILRIAGNIAEYSQLQSGGYQLRRESLNLCDTLADMEDT